MWLDHLLSKESPSLGGQVVLHWFGVACLFIFCCWGVFVSHPHCFGVVGANYGKTGRKAFPLTLSFVGVGGALSGLLSIPFVWLAHWFLVCLVGCWGFGSSWVGASGLGVLVWVGGLLVNCIVVVLCLYFLCDFVFIS